MARETSNVYMGFLDNLENQLKSLESQEERDPNVAQKREDDRARTLAVAPWSARFRDSGYVKALFEKAAIRGHGLRTKVYMAWVESALRLEARGRVLQFNPTADGIVAEYADGEGKPVVEKVDLESDPDELLGRWLGSEQRIQREEPANE